MTYRVGASLRQVELTQLGVGLLEVRDRRHQAGLESLDRHDVLDAGTHRVPGEALGVGDHDRVGPGAERRTQRVDLRGGTAAAGGGIGLVRDEDRRVCDVVAIHTAPLGLGDHGLHHLGDVVDVEPGAVEGAVRGDRPEHLTDGLQPTLSRGLGGLDDERRRAHSDDHPVTATVERDRGLLDRLVGRRGAGGQEACRDPRQELVAGHVVRGHHDDPPAAPGPDPVLGQRQCLGGARARRVDLGVRAPGPDDLGELRVTHGQAPEEEPSVERERLGLQQATQLGDPTVGLGAGGLVALHRAPDRFQGQELLAPPTVGVVAPEVVGERGVAREGGGEDDAGVVAQGVRKPPTLGKLRAQAGRLVAHHQGQAGVTHGVETGTDRQAGHGVEGGIAGGIDAELLDDVEGCTASGELHDLRLVVDGLERRVAGLPLDEPGDVQVDLLLTELLRDRVDELLPVQDPLQVLVVEHLRHPRQTQGRAGDDDRFGPDRGRGVGGATTRDLQALLQYAGEEVPELDVGVSGQGVGGQGVGGHGASRRWDRDRWRARAGGGGSGRVELRSGGPHVGRAGSQAGGPQAAQRRVDRGHVAVLRVVGEQGEHVVVLVQDVLDEAVQRLLRPDLDEDPRPGFVQRPQAADELHGGGDLTPEQVDHRLLIGRHRVELTGHVGDDRQVRAPQVQAAQGLPQWLGRGRHDRGVEGVADRDPGRVDAFGQEGLHRSLHRLGGSSDHGLAEAVDVRDDDSGVDRGHHPVDLLQRPEDCCHGAVVGHRDRRHLVPSGAHGLECRLERHRTGRDEGAVLAEAVSHDHVGADVVLAEEPGQGQVRGEDGGLGDLGPGQLLLQVTHGVGVGVVDEDVRREGAVEHRGHDPVGLRERVGHDRYLGAQVLEHVDVLRALSGVEERHLGGGTPAHEDPLGAQHLPHRRGSGAEGLDRLACLHRELGGIRVVEGDPDSGGQGFRVGNYAGRCRPVGGR